MDKSVARAVDPSRIGTRRRSQDVNHGFSWHRSGKPSIRQPGSPLASPLLCANAMSMSSWLSIFGLSVTACASESAATTHTAVVSAIRQPCIGEGTQLCLVLTEENESSWHYGGIDGFEHRWGVETELRYHEVPAENPLADESSVRFVLDEIVRETPRSDPEFELSFSELAPGNVWFLGESSPLDMRGTSVDCAPSVCSELLTHQAVGFTATMQFTSENERLVAVSSSKVERDS